MHSDTITEIQEQTLTLRPTAFCLIIDLNKNLILVENQSGLVGGGIEKGETPEEACIREIREETEESINIDKNKLHFFDEIQFQTRDFTSDNQTWNGKKGYFFVYEYDSTRFAGLEANKVNIPHGKINWCDIDKFFEMNNRISFAQFKQFCLDKNLPR